MFILDSLMIAGLRWVLDTARTAAESEMNDDSALREQLLEAELRREMGEISDEEFRATEADLLARIRQIKDRREGSGSLTLAAEPMEAPAGSTFQVEAELSGDFHAPPAAGDAARNPDPEHAPGGKRGRRRSTPTDQAHGRAARTKRTAGTPRPSGPSRTSQPVRTTPPSRTARPTRE